MLRSVAGSVIRDIIRGLMGAKRSPQQDRLRGVFRHMPPYIEYVLTGPQLFRFSDRKEGKYLLAPTHEEEITALVARSAKSYKNLPLRLYQICKIRTFTHGVFMFAYV